MSDKRPMPWTCHRGTLQFQEHMVRGSYILAADGGIVGILKDGAEWSATPIAQEIVRAVNSHAALLAALKAIEWAAEGYAAEGLHPACPACRAWQSHGHAPDCQLAKALRAAKPD